MIYLVFFFLFLSAVPAFAQYADTLGRDLAITGIQDGATIKLRWATGSPVVWSTIKRHGIWLTRHEARATTSDTLNAGQRLNVWPEARWQQLAQTLPAAAQAAQLLRNDEPERAGLSDYALADLEQNKLTSLLLLAEFSFEIAEGLALAYADREVQSDKLYKYEIVLPDTVFGDTLRAEFYLDTSTGSTLPPVLGLEATPGDGVILLKWMQTQIHSGYFVERRQPGTTEWQRLNQQPLLFASNYPYKHLYKDSVDNYITYQYRVRGIDAFGRLSPPSEAAATFARDLTPPSPPYNLKWAIRDSGVVITWTNPPPEPDLVGYGMLRSTKADEDYRPVHRKLLSPGTTSYFDVVPGPGTYFYRLVAADTARNVSVMSVRAMAVVADSIAPAPPVNLQAIADTTGMIHLTWSPPNDRDVGGYRIYRRIRGSGNYEFLPITPGPVTDTTFADTLMASVRDRFVYRVRTVDMVGNYSAPSEPVTVRFPDVDPPAPPIIEDYSIADRRVRIRYVSASRDVAQYEIQRYLRGMTEPPMAMTTAATTWEDTTAGHGIEYQYQIAAVDSAGNRSAPSKALFARPFWKMKLAAPPAPEVSYNPPNQAVTVRWSFPSEAEWSAIVFRKLDNRQFLQISPLLQATAFVDSDIKSGQYAYAVRFYFPGQGGTPLGKEAVIEVPAQE
jgi:hypothetical protein